MHTRLPIIIWYLLNGLKHPNSLNLATKCCKINSTITNCICKFGYEEYNLMDYFECKITKTLTFPKTAKNLNKYPNIYVLAIVNTTNLGSLNNKILISAGENVLELYLNHTGITFLEEAAFINYKNITTLDLSHNNMSTLSEKAFKGLSTLYYLNLKNINMKSIEHLVRLVSYLNFQADRTIKVYTNLNPFECDCLGLQAICMYTETMKTIKRYRNLSEDMINDFYTSLISSNCIMPKNTLCMSLYHWLKGEKINDGPCSNNMKNFTMNLTQCIIMVDTATIKLTDSRGILLADCVQEKKLNIKDNLSLIQITDTFEKNSLFMSLMSLQNNMCENEDILKAKNIFTKADYLSIIENLTSPIYLKMKTISHTARMTSIKYNPTEDYTKATISSPLSSFINRLKVTNMYDSNISKTNRSVTFDSETEKMARSQKVEEYRLLGPKGIIIPLSSFILGLILPLSCFYLYVWVHDYNKVRRPSHSQSHY
ncbi:unnamed protein product [Gordionus sp. m RMFG-2023]